MVSNFSVYGAAPSILFKTPQTFSIIIWAIWLKKPPGALRFNPCRHRGDWCKPPCGFSGISFLLTVGLSPFFSIAFRPSFYVPPENFKTLTPLTCDLWRHNWGHVRRKMRSVAHYLQTSPFLLVIWMWTWLGWKHQFQVVLMHSTGHPVLRRSTEVNWGQMRSMTFAVFFRVLMPSKVIWGDDFDSDIHFALRRLEMRSWNHRVIKGQWRHDPKMIFRTFDPKNYPWSFKDHRNVLYSSQGTRWTMQFCSSSIRSKVIGDHGFSSLFVTWPDLRGHWLT